MAERLEADLLHARLADLEVHRAHRRARARRLAAPGVSNRAITTPAHAIFRRLTDRRPIDLIGVVFAPEGTADAEVAVHLFGAEVIHRRDDQVTDLAAAHATDHFRVVLRLDDALGFRGDHLRRQ
ncbi:hypothetical protein [Wenzhouxiangella marina]|uniref:hypothetical protein n=1 Tax=Wenzhouxiangella marina TaxID=1579979 RepID=UPI003CCBF3EF